MINIIVPHNASEEIVMEFKGQIANMMVGSLNAALEQGALSGKSHQGKWTVITKAAIGNAQILFNGLSQEHVARGYQELLDRALTEYLQDLKDKLVKGADVFETTKYLFDAYGRPIGGGGLLDSGSTSQN